MAPRPIYVAPEVIARAWAESHSAHALAQLMGVKHPTTAAKKAREAGFEIPAPHWTRVATPPAEQQPPPLPEGVASDEELLAYLQAKGYQIQDVPLCEDREFEYRVDALDGQGTFSLGVVSDTHGGSKYAQRSFLNVAYDYFERHEIPLVLHPGDITAGSVDMHRGMVYEQHAHGADQQTEYVCESYPRRSGITTKIISGNHDHSFLKAGGMNVAQRIAQERPDIEYLGMSGAYLTVNGVRIYLHHGSGGTAYARSYKLQRQIEQFSPENKPKVLIVGHYHVTCVLEHYRNVYAFMAGCLEAQTPYLVEKGLYPELGFSVLKVTYDENGAVGFEKKWEPCYVPLENDV